MDVWSLACAKIQKSSFVGTSFRFVVESLFNKCSLEEMVQFAGLARRIWLRRNKVVFGGPMISPQTLVLRTTQAIDDFQSVMAQRETSLPTPTESLPCSWTLPPPEWVKANWDASLETQRGIMGCAVVIRDHRGQLIVAKCFSRKGCPSPLTAEALAALMAVQLSKERGFQPVHLEGDAKSVVNAITCAGADRSRLGHVLDDLKMEVQSIPHWKMSFIKCEGNNAAHVLAKHASQHVLDKTWEVPPDCIRDLLLLEQFALVH
ncbi:uncharacterized protein LOC132182040 [Corylus avellana]|uniref:uncharacterized protein LOC132182040 n=1 Tax=Corylus avellana TaxID=13451 RepID=UPI00286A6927|nr:uncharacterized protein LOC132182040 [Corylus avellana]